MKYFAFLLLLLCDYGANAQLQIGAGTNWKSDNSTYVVLNNTGMQYDAATATLANTFKFNGSTNATISGASLPIFSKIELAKTGASRLILQRNLNIAQTVNFQGGLLDLNGFALNLGSNALFLNESENSHMMGTDGYARIIVDLGTPTAVNPGNLGATITATQNLGTTSVFRGVKSQSGNAGGNSILRYFDIIPANNTALDATLRINYFDAELNGLAENNLIQFRSTDNVNWVAQGFSTRDASLNYVEKSTIQAFSRWTLSNAGNALPVHFIQFSTSCENSGIEITWKTTTEENSAKFLVQKSSDGINFSSVATIAAAGNSTAEQTYHYTDASPGGQTVFYRIAGVDNDGQTLYTAVNRVRCGSPVNELMIWPNPASETLNLNITQDAPSAAIIRLVNSLGSTVYQAQTTLPAGTSVWQIPVAQLSSGVYMVTVTRENDPVQETKKFVKK